MSDQKSRVLYRKHCIYPNCHEYFDVVAGYGKVKLYCDKHQSKYTREDYSKPVKGNGLETLA